MKLRFRILLSCIVCVLLALLIQTFLFKETSSEMIYALSREESENSLKNMQEEIYHFTGSMEKKLIKIYNEQDFISALKDENYEIERFQEDFYRKAYEFGAGSFETSDKVMALYLYTMNHEIISTYRKARTPKHNYPADIYEDMEVYNAKRVQEYVESDEKAMLISGYYNTYREKDMIRFVLKLYNNSNRDRKIGYVVCDVDSKVFADILEKYCTENTMYIWLQSDSDRPIVSRGSLSEVDDGIYQVISEQIQAGDQAFITEQSTQELFQVGQRKYNLTAYSLMPESILQQNQQALTVNLLTIAVVMVIVSAVLIFIVSSSITKPLDKLIRTIQRIAGGEMELRADVTKNDEIGELGRNFNVMLDQVEELKEKENQANLLLLQAEYKALQAQINPHFLYNTLDTMSSIAEVKDCQEVNMLSQSLANIFRYSLNMKDPFSTVAKEIVHLKNYCYVMDVRMQDHVQYFYDIDTESLRARVPRICIQPLVENALNHGLRNKRGGKQIHIDAKVRGKLLEICVADNGVGMDAEQMNESLRQNNLDYVERGNSIGIHNINARLKILYGEEYGLHIDSVIGEGTKVKMVIPKIEGGNRRMDERRYKVLIADDEYWTREKLKRMIPWENYSLELLEPAVDGEDVLKKMEMEVPDILITDIDMPFLSGTELLAVVQEKYPKVISFVVSGYNDFAYVKDSFMAGSINYLMKPVTKMDLVGALVKALHIIGEREHEQKRLQEAASFIQDMEFSEMIAHRQLPLASSMSANTYMDLAGISLILLKIHNLQETVRKSNLDRNGFSFRMKEKIRALLQNEKAIVFNYIYHSNEFLIITETGGEELSGAAERLMTGLSEILQTSLTLCISGHAYTMDSIHKAYMETIGLLMERKFCGKNELMVCGKEGGGQGRMTLHFPEEKEKQANFYLAGRDGEGVCRVILTETGLDRCDEQGWSYLEVKQTVRQIMNVLQDFAVRECSREKAIDVENVTESLDKTVESLDIGSVCDMMREVVSMLVPEKKEAATDSMKAIVQEAAAWIDRHFYEELTLTTLAEQFHVEHSYFSRVFRQEIGESPVLYITGKRMEKAKEYIKEGKKNLTEVAFMVGYDDYTYFSRVFRKNTGMSPREYRGQFEEA